MECAALFILDRKARWWPTIARDRKLSACENERWNSGATLVAADRFGIFREESQRDEMFIVRKNQFHL
jgi:hypothetical protein